MIPFHSTVAFCYPQVQHPARHGRLVCSKKLVPSSGGHRHIALARKHQRARSSPRLNKPHQEKDVCSDAGLKALIAVPVLWLVFSTCSSPIAKKEAGDDWQVGSFFTNVMEICKAYAQSSV